MVTEFEIKRKIAEIEALPVTAFRKVKEFLKLERHIKSGLRKLEECYDILKMDGQDEQATRISNAIKRLQELCNEIRTTACHLLAIEKGKPLKMEDYGPVFTS